MLPHNTPVAVPQRGWKARQDAAKDKLEGARSPLALAIRRVRAATAGLADAKSVAQLRFDAQHAPQPLPLPSHCHPQLVRLITEFLAERGIVDPLAPLAGVVPLDAYIAIETAQAQKELAEAERDLARLETREARFADLLRAGPEGLADALATMRDDESAEDMPGLLADDLVEAGRRGPGRPRKQEG